MFYRNYAILLLSSIFLFSCAKESIPVTTVLQTDIQVKQRPRQLDLKDVKFYVVTPENYDNFMKEFIKSNGTEVYYALSVQDYENMSENFADITRYIIQANDLLLYYETAAKPEKEEKEE